MDNRTIHCMAREKKEMKDIIKASIFSFLIIFSLSIATFSVTYNFSADLDYCHSIGYDGIEIRDTIFDGVDDVCYKNTEWDNKSGEYTKIYAPINRINGGE